MYRRGVWPSSVVSVSISSSPAAEEAPSVHSLHVSITDDARKPTQPVRLAARRRWFVPRTLTAAPVEKRVEEPERRVSPRRCERLVLLFPRLRPDTVSLLPCADRLQ